MNTYNEPDETGTYNEPNESSTYNEPDEMATYSEPGTYCETGTHSTNACETPPELPPYDGARTPLPLHRTRLLHISK